MKDILIEKTGEIINCEKYGEFDRELAEKLYKMYRRSSILRVNLDTGVEAEKVFCLIKTLKKLKKQEREADVD